MIKRTVLIVFFISILSTNALCLRNFIENTDFTVNFEEKSPAMAAVLHINFKNIMPEPDEAEEIIKQNLKIYGNLLISKKKASAIVKKEVKYKNIIGSVWYVNSEDPQNPIKIRFQDNLGAYVWIGKTKKIVTFPNYIAYLKKERENKKIKNKKEKEQKISENM